jgi:luciferase-like monooxygenase
MTKYEPWPGRPGTAKKLESILVPFSVLDLAPINQGSDAAHAFRNSLDLAQHAERWHYRRFWLAEHHNMPGIASAATAVVIGYIAGGTKTIRVGSGGIMLPCCRTMRLWSLPSSSEPLSPFTRAASILVLAALLERTSERRAHCGGTWRKAPKTSRTTSWN